MKKINFTVLLLLPVAAFASHISETMTLTKGWNAIYLESTPTNALCEDFFAGSPVARVASYHSDAYSSTRQIADDGTEIGQKPVSYHVWVPGNETASTMTALVGGCVYVIFTTQAWTSGEFLGVPSAPKQTWRTTSGETGFMNLAGVSADTNATPTAKAYFGEGPFGTASGSAYQIAGNKTAAPTFLPLAIGASPKLHGGMAYALTAAKDGDWPGVIGAQDDGVFFGPNENFAVFRVRNCGTKARVFRFTMERSATPDETLPPLSRRLPRADAISAPAYTNVEENAAWDLSLEAGEVLEQIFSIDRSGLAAGSECGAILKIEDLGGSMMRVRLPIHAKAAKAGAAAYPAGLWVGEIALTRVSGIDDETPEPVAAGGTLKMNVMVHVDTNGTCRLLQRVAAGVDANGAERLFRNLEDVPAEVENPRRISTVMMSVDTPIVAAADGSAFGTNTVFTWTIAPTASDNPFRHAWHPDHDGKTADYRGEAPSGDVPENYAYPIKPELWSIGNSLELSWHEKGDPALPAIFPHTSDETTSGIVTWEVTGLAANGPIKSVGTFTLRRVFAAAALE